MRSRTAISLNTLSQCALGGQDYRASSFASLAWLSSNRAVLVPFFLSTPALVTQLYWVNGATVSGNVDAGVYDLSGTRLVSTGSTAQSGTSAFQGVTLGTPALIGAGRFYLALVLDNTTGTIYKAQNGFSRALAIGEATSAFPLPAAVTLSAAGEHQPMVGFSGVVL